MKPNKCNHNDCKYRGASDSSWRCNYSDITGHSRIAWHMKNKYSIDPAECKLYERGERQKSKYSTITFIKSEADVGTTGRLKHEPKKKTVRPKTERKPVERKLSERGEKILELYKAGKTDAEIAEALGIARNTVCSFRKNYKLPLVNEKDKLEQAKKKQELVKRMLEAGFSNNEIAKLAHISDGTMSSWRHKFGLVGKQPKDEEAKAEILRELAVSNEQLEIKEDR